MKEQLILFKTAKLAKEKGFDKNTLYWYHRNTKKLNKNDLMFSMNKLTNNYSAPTQALLQKWLRETCNIIVASNHYEFKASSNNGWYYTIGNSIQTLYYIGKFKTYEKALERGLQEALKLIK